MARMPAALVSLVLCQVASAQPTESAVPSPSGPSGTAEAGDAAAPPAEAPPEEVAGDNAPAVAPENPVPGDEASPGAQAADGSSATSVPAAEPRTSSAAPEGAAPRAKPERPSPWMTEEEAAAAEAAEPPPPAAPPPPPEVVFRWGAHAGVSFSPVPEEGWKTPTWLPIGGELGFGATSWGVSLVGDYAPVCLGDGGCSGSQLRVLAAAEGGVGPVAESALRLVYLGAGFGYRLVDSEVGGGSSTWFTDDMPLWFGELTASLLIPTSRALSIGPSVALGYNFTETADGAPMVLIGLRLLHLPALAK